MTPYISFNGSQLELVIVGTNHIDKPRVVYQQPVMTWEAAKVAYMTYCLNEPVKSCFLPEFIERQWKTHTGQAVKMPAIAA